MENLFADGITSISWLCDIAPCASSSLSTLISCEHIYSGKSELTEQFEYPTHVGCAAMKTAFVGAVPSDGIKRITLISFK